MRIYFYGKEGISRCRVTITASRPGASPLVPAPSLTQPSLWLLWHCPVAVPAGNLLWSKQVPTRLPGAAHRQSFCATSRCSAYLDKRMFNHDVRGYSEISRSCTNILQQCIFIFSILSVCRSGSFICYLLPAYGVENIPNCIFICRE